MRNQKKITWGDEGSWETIPGKGLAGALQKLGIEDR
jgi:hypothetical protein